MMSALIAAPFTAVFATFNQLFRRIVTADFHDFRTCELIAPFIVDMPHMNFEPLPCDLMP
jgi:hypothetical protein